MWRTFLPVVGFCAAFWITARYRGFLRSVLRSWLEAPHG